MSASRMIGRLLLAGWLAVFGTPASALVPDTADTNLWTWFDAGDSDSVNGIGADSHGDAATTWMDITDAGEHSLLRSSDGNATFETNIINGLPTVRFPGNMDVWGASTGTGEFRTIANPFSLVAVVRLNDINSTDYLFDRSTNAGGIGLRITYDSGYQWEAVAERNSPAIETLWPPPMCCSVCSRPISW